MTTETKDLPSLPETVGWLTRFVNRSGLNCQVLCNHNSVGDYRDIDPGATSERVYSESQMHEYASEAIRASATSAPEHIADVSKLVSEFVIADLAMIHLGSYAEKDYDFAMAVMKALQKAQLSGTTPKPAEPTQMERT